jgi:7,8-dihydropterin-6-yl-methyl-4-(beta-D-ribofuranosyl)aminobenzene 5'-phosphate synthase
MELNLMRKSLGVIIVFLIFLLPSKLTAENEITITVTYNNIPFNQDLKTAWGESVFIKGMEKSILFDTGGDGSILLFNMEQLKIDPTEVDIVFLSHIHPDHVGGLDTFLRENNEALICLPSSFPDDFKNKVGNKLAKISSIKEVEEICKNVWSTGELGTSIVEQSLVLNTPKGLIIITGCAHPGIVEIVEFVKNYFEEKIFMVLGGFHLTSTSESKIKEFISELKRLRVKKISPSHCSGEKAIELFKEAWSEDFVESGCGAKIKIPLNNKRENRNNTN